jgi:hypothetical protein
MRRRHLTKSKGQPLLRPLPRYDCLRARPGEEVLPSWMWYALYNQSFWPTVLTEVAAA